MRELGYGDALDELLSSADQALFLLADSANIGGIGIEVARSVVDRIVFANKKNWNLDIFTVATFDDLPDNVKNNIAKSYGEDTAKDVKDLVHYDNKVYVIAENNESETDIDQASFHEIEGYIVIRKLYGNTTPETINIDSIGRPVSNSESRLIDSTD